MSWSIRIVRVAGIDVKIHLTFLLLLAWIAFSYYRVGGAAAAVEGVVFILLLFGCVLLHEFGHALAARRYGIRTPDITLLPIGGVARLQRMPDKPVQELVVAIAGPLVNVAIAIVLFFVVGRMSGLRELVLLEDPQIGLPAKLLAVNVALVLFNLIPAFPMDGGRVLRALLAMRMEYARATQIAATIGQGLAFLFGFVGLFANPLLIFIALFVYLGAAQEASLAKMREIADGLPVSAAVVTELVTLPLDATLERAADALLATSQHEFPLVDGAGVARGVLTRDQLIRGLRQEGPDAAAYELMHRDLPTISVHAPFGEAFRRMQEAGVPALPVVDDLGRLVGLLTPENVGEMMMVHSALGGRSPFGRAGEREIRST